LVISLLLVHLALLPVGQLQTEVLEVLLVDPRVDVPRVHVLVLLLVLVV
jgi:hypothetical protein